MSPAPVERSIVPWFRLTSCGVDVVFPAAAVRQILPDGDVMPVPLTRPGVAGIIAREGKAIPIFRLCVLLGRADGGSGAAREIAVIEQEGALVGLQVERVDPAPSRPLEGEEIIDGITLLASAGVFDGGRGDQPAARAAEGAL